MESHKTHKWLVDIKGKTNHNSRVVSIQSTDIDQLLKYPNISLIRHIDKSIYIMAALNNASQSQAQEGSIME